MKIISFTDDYAKKVVDMNKRSQEGWPTGLDEVIIDERDILDWYNESKYIEWYLAEEDDKIVGICTFVENDKDTVYLEFLNVDPLYHGRGFGKELVKKCVEKSIELGYKKVTLGTWAGNMKAVPVYKKCGFFWIPDTDVDMVSFIPLVAKLEKDWYNSLQKKIEVKEDEYEKFGEKIWSYKFKNFKVYIDSENSSICGIEKKNFKALMYSKDSKIILDLDFKGFVILDDKKIEIDGKKNIEKESKKEKEFVYIISNEETIKLECKVVKKEINVSSYPENLYFNKKKSEFYIIIENKKEDSEINIESELFSKKIDIKKGEKKGVKIDVEFPKEGIYPVKIDEKTLYLRYVEDFLVHGENEKFYIDNSKFSCKIDLKGGKLTFYDNEKVFEIEERIIGYPPSKIKDSKFNYAIEGKKVKFYIEEFSKEIELEDCLKIGYKTDIPIKFRINPKNFEKMILPAEKIVEVNSAEVDFGAFKKLKENWIEYKKKNKTLHIEWENSKKVQTSGWRSEILFEKDNTLTLSYLKKETPDLKDWFDIEINPKVIENDFEVSIKNLINKKIEGKLVYNGEHSFVLRYNEEFKKKFSETPEKLQRKKIKISTDKFDIEKDIVLAKFRGNIDFKVSPEYAGSIYSLKKDGKEVLFSTYPSPREFIWFNPFYGGIFPTVSKKEWQMPPLRKEKFKMEKIKDGYKLSTIINTKKLKNLSLECFYIKKGDVLIPRVILKNNASFPQKVYFGFGIFLNAKNPLLWYMDNGIKNRKSTLFEFWTKTDWACVEDKDRFITCVGDITAMSFGRYGMHFAAKKEAVLFPDESKENRVILRVYNNLEEAKEMYLLKDLDI
ncbi:hypothetical protein DRN58_04385 [Thermococci archaeon]|nr:MAG: hypothetical protein DRN58_04385 [Thermococci archaeon]